MREGDEERGRVREGDKERGRVREIRRGRNERESKGERED